MKNGNPLWKNRRLTMAGRRAVTGYMFVLPWLIGFICFYIISIIQTVKFSMS